MKVRTGFVSNSSSSSFLISADNITDEQVRLIDKDGCYHNDYTDKKIAAIDHVGPVYVVSGDHSARCFRSEILKSYGIKMDHVFWFETMGEAW